MQKAQLYLEKAVEFDPENQEALELLGGINNSQSNELLIGSTRDFSFPLALKENPEDKGDIFFEIVQEISKGSTAKLEELYPFDPNLTDEAGNSLLHYAIGCDNYDAMVFLCEKGANVNLANKEGEPPLFCAARIDKIRFFRYLITKETRLDFRDKTNGSSFLHKCAEFGNLEIITYILDENVIPIDDEDKQGMSPLFDACQEGHLDVAKLLISRGADVKKECTFKYPPIFIATARNHSSVISLLLDHAVDPTRNYNGSNIFFVAIRYESVDCVALLVERIPELLKISNEDGIPPLFFASSLGKAKIVSFLIKQGADPGERVSRPYIFANRYYQRTSGSGAGFIPSCGER